MGKVTGFLEFTRDKQPYRPVAERLRDWHQVILPWSTPKLQRQAARCMDCGIPFCHQGCPLGNLIPHCNDLVYRDDWREPTDPRHANNSSPECTAPLCPARGEEWGALGINDAPVTTNPIERATAARAFDEGWTPPEPPVASPGKRAAIGGPGPAGLAA